MHGLGRAELDCTMLHLAQSGDTVIIIDLPNISAHEVPGDQDCTMGVQMMPLLLSLSP